MSAEQLPLSKAAEYLLEECRMVLPGMQALFGFQLIAVFNAGFAEKLSHTEQLLHLGAIGLIVISIALIMTPAAYHRRTSPMQITSAFISLSTRLLLWSMWPLAAGLCLDFYLISRVILRSSAAAVLAAVLFVLFFGLWSVLPRVMMSRDPRP